MRLTWKCEHCCQTDDDKEKMEKHEVTCIFNPSNKHCYTCDNHHDEYDSDYCTVYHDFRGLTALPTNDFNKFYDVLDRHNKCEKWSSHEVKMKTLKKIKDKIDENS